PFVTLVNSNEGSNSSLRRDLLPTPSPIGGEKNAFIISAGQQVRPTSTKAENPLVAQPLIDRRPARSLIRRSENPFAGHIHSGKQIRPVCQQRRDVRTVQTCLQPPLN